MAKTKKNPEAFKNPETITVMNLQVVVMPNGEIICKGKTVGFTDQLGTYLKPDYKPVSIFISRKDPCYPLAFDLKNISNVIKLMPDDGAKIYSLIRN